MPELDPGDYELIGSLIHQDINGEFEEGSYGGDISST